jgi:hypothetical protein
MFALFDQRGDDEDLNILTIHSLVADLVLSLYPYVCWHRANVLARNVPVHFPVRPDGCWTLYQWLGDEITNGRSAR